MACFLVPTAEAIVTTIIKKARDSKQKKNIEAGIETEPKKSKFNFGGKLNWLNNMLWGGSALLAFEHIWHGEVVPWFPFLTAAANRADAEEMLREMSTSGVAMAALVTLVWVIIVLVSGAIENRKPVADPDQKGGAV